MASDRVFKMTFDSIYPLYVQKVERKEKRIDDLNKVIFWLTGYDKDSMQKQIDQSSTLQEFFDQAPSFNPKASLIKGIICGVRVEEIKDPLMRKIRYMDKLVDEVAKGKKIENILRK